MFRLSRTSTRFRCVCSDMKTIALAMGIALVCASDSAGSEQEPPTQCSVDIDKISVYRVPVGELDYRKNVIPAIHAVAQAHFSNLRRYTIPFETFWRVTGLDLILGRPVSPCCELCHVTPCSKPVRFERLGWSEYVASFVVDFDSRNDVVLANRIPPNVSAELVLRPTIIGTATVTPEGVQLFFSQGMPNLLLNVNAEDVFKGNIPCTATRSTWGVVQHATPGPRIPNLPIFFDPR